MNISQPQPQTKIQKLIEQRHDQFLLLKAELLEIHDHIACLQSQIDDLKQNLQQPQDLTGLRRRISTLEIHMRVRR